ncbi:hypothetical protein BDR26DRAFT_899597 [Obelidium mucronatum]|nr:hypothetical protein BDR26DRAFT_899597 [Obelidium mucronatum]
MPWCESLSQYLSSKSTSPDNQETLDPGFSICEETASMIVSFFFISRTNRAFADFFFRLKNDKHVFFAMHSSYNELRNLIRVIKPHTVHACVLDTSSPWNNAETLCAFDDLLGSRKSTSAIPFSRNRSSGGAAAIQRGKSVAELLLEDLLNGKVPHAETSSAEMESTCEMEETTQSLEITQPLDPVVEELGSLWLVVSAASEEVKKDSSGEC